jgi:hypothetical protein
MYGCMQVWDISGYFHMLSRRTVSISACVGECDGRPTIRCMYVDVIVPAHYIASIVATVNSWFAYHTSMYMLCGYATCTHTVRNESL